MNFTSPLFLIYLPVVILLYWLIPQKGRWIFLLLASYFFYAFLNPWLIFLIVSTTLVTYLCGLGISKVQKKPWKTFFLIISLVVSLGMLFVFKYLDFAYQLIVEINHLFKGDMTFNAFNLILPVGISFYTFQTLSYVIDVYKEKYPAEMHLGYYALYVSFFPQLVAGPIERPENLLPQLKAEHHLHSQNFTDGFFYLITGFLKKIVIADVLGLFVNFIYQDVTSSSGISLIIATLFFAVEIFCDFSGYSDIALGCAALMDIRLSENFRRPYSARGIRDFWKRWHITLTSWLTDYIYIPLGGSRKGFFRRIINVMVVFLLSGLWHGASLHFVLWGVLNGLWIVIELLLQKPMEKWKDNSPFFSKLCDIFTIPLSFLLICCLWVFFRANNISDAFLVYQRVFTSFASGNGLAYFNDIKVLLQCLLALILFVLLPYLPKLDFKEDSQHQFNKEQFASLTMIYTCLIFLIAFTYVYQLSTTGESSFIYFQF